MRRRGSALLCLVAVSAVTACGSTVQQSTASSSAAAPAMGGSDGLGGVPVGPAGDGPAVEAGADAAGPAGAAEAPGAVGGDLSGRPAGSVATTAPGTAVGQPAASGGGGIPARGRGWDEKVVRIGVTTQKDVNAAANNLGIKSLNAGDQEGQALAVAAEMNRRGGLFGRKVEIVFRDHRTASLQSDPAGESQATCTYYTQDRPVIAVINPASLLDTPTFRACMAKAMLPVFALSVQAYDTQVHREYSPYYYSSVSPPYDALAPVLISRLKAQGFFGGWNPVTGAPGTGEVRTGVIVLDDAVGARVAEIMSKALTQAGLSKPLVFRYRTSNEYSNAVLQFRNDGVTHVLGTDSRMLVFLQTADSQGYRPRYGISSYLAPNAFMEETAPDRQLIGSMGVGFAPSLDVNQARDAEDMPGEVECRTQLAKGGQTFEGKRFAEAVGYALCDAFRLLAAAATGGGGFLGPQLAAGLQQVGPDFRPSFAFSSGLGRGRLFVPGAVRDLRYDTGCSCYRYADRKNRPL